MSDPPTTSSEPPPHHHHHHPHPHHHHQQQQLLHLPLIHGGAATVRPNTAAATSSTVAIREYRKGNWTLQETMILITAKRLDDERRSKATAPPDPAARKGGELRWKWVENYCWSHGCHRSQNQCNDKWDNLLRDYKKVREYESRACDQSLHLPSSSSSISYWKMEKHERKDNNLPSNMAFEVYQALNDVVHKKLRVVSLSLPAPPPPPPPSSALPAALPPPSTATVSPPVSESSSSGTESSEKKENMETKRRKMVDIGRCIERSTSTLAQTLRNCEEQREIRHQQLMELQKCRLQIEEARNHIHRQGIADLVTAVANLSGINNNRTTTTASEGYGCNLYNGEDVRMLKEQNEAMQAELMSVKTELSQLRDQMPSLMQTMMHNMIHNIPPPPPPTSSMDPSRSCGDA